MAMREMRRRKETSEGEGMELIDLREAVIGGGEGVKKN